MTALDTTQPLPAVRPAAPVDEDWLTRSRLVVWLSGWDKRREDWWDRLLLRFQSRTGDQSGYVGRHRRMAWMDLPTDAYPIVEVGAT